MAVTVQSSCIGIAICISRFTPDNDVYVEVPVKFIKAKLVSAGMSSSHAITLGMLLSFSNRLAA